MRTNTKKVQIAAAKTKRGTGEMQRGRECSFGSRRCGLSFAAKTQVGLQTAAALRQGRHPRAGGRPLWETLRAMREASGFTSTEIAKVIGIKPMFLWQLERGVGIWPTEVLKSYLAAIRRARRRAAK